jgi:heme-degrading monooxygenase HmoA
MISLNVYLSPKSGRDAELVSAIRKWLGGMSQQPGFVNAAILKPYAAEELAKLEALTPPTPIEVVCFWRSESERLEWVTRPIFEEVYPPVEEAADAITFTMQTVEHSWNV